MINSRAEYVAYLDPKGNHSDYLRVVECEIKSPKVVCPDKSKKPLAYHKPKVREIVDRKKPIHDMIDGFYPAKITFRVANWTCPCKCEFRDPAFKYPVSQEYTEAYKQYVVETFIDNPRMLESDIQTLLDIPDRILKQAIREFRAKFDNIYKSYPLCEEIYLHKFDYLGREHIIGFGQPARLDCDNPDDVIDPVLLGFCDSFNDAEKTFDFSSTYKRPYRLIVSNRGLQEEAFRNGYDAIFKSFDQFYEPFQKLQNIVEELEDQKKRYDLMTLLVWYQSRGRRTESRKSRKIGQHLKQDENLVMFKTANRYDSVEDIAKNPTNCKAVPIKSIFARFKKKRSQGNSYVASNENLIHGIKCSEKLKNFYFVDNREQLMFPMKELGLPKKKK